MCSRYIWLKAITHVRISFDFISPTSFFFFLTIRWTTEHIGRSFSHLLRFYLKRWTRLWLHLSNSHFLLLLLMAHLVFLFFIFRVPFFQNIQNPFGIHLESNFHLAMMMNHFNTTSESQERKKYGRRV